MGKNILLLTFLLLTGCAAKQPLKPNYENPSVASVQTSFFLVTEEIPADAVSVKDFGALGDGVTNDTDAFAAASDTINAQGGGTLFIPPGTYKVGKQIFSEGSGFKPQPIIAIHDCGSPVKIIGNGAKLIAADDLRFGSFDPVSGEAVSPQLPFYDQQFAAHAYSMLELLGNQDVEVSDLELDGNLDQLVLGGKWGDTGWQLRAVGVWAMNNNSLTLKRIHSHHHALDGITIGFSGLTTSSSATPTKLENILSEYNGRQGFSWTGGIGLRASNSKFNHNGLGLISSSPRSGVDIEAEDSVNRDAVFENCEFANNGGVGLVADSGDSANITIRRSKFIGTKSWAIVPHKPFMRFEDCEVHGSIAKAFGSTADPSAATQFLRTKFDDSDVSGFPSTFTYGYLADLGGGGVENVTFDSCTFTNKKKRGLYIQALQSAPVQIKNSNVVHGYASSQSNDFQSYFFGVRFENTRFSEAFQTAIAAGAYYSSMQSAEFGASCTVSGNSVRIVGLTTGPILPGLYPKP
jgi:hypothetical protein